MIHFNCSECGKDLHVKDVLAGKKGTCPHCRQSITVPAGVASTSAASGNEEVDDARTLPPTARSVSEESGQSGAAQETVTYRPGAVPPQTIGGDPLPASCSSEHYDFLAPPEQPDELGRLGTYRILRVLGAGGMGVVFLAEDPTLKRKVALKAMLPGLAASESARQRFLREAQTAAALEHDNIVAIFQVGEDRGVPFIAMPFLKGEPLEARIQREPVLSTAEVIRIGRETAKGLAVAHAADLIHRDIKPANLWLEGQEGRIKILDFGLARARVDDAGLTQNGTIIGTPAYMAPEQANAQTLDVRCDLFSLGCVLYRLSTGELPFKGATTISTLMAVGTVQPPPPRELNPVLPPGLSDLIMKLLSKEPAGRPSSAEAFIQALDEAVLRASVAAEEGTPPSQGQASLRADAEAKRPQAAVHHGAYLDMLEKKDWTGALKELVKAIKLDAKHFSPFPTGKYQMQRILGADEFSVAFLCKHKFLDAQVVVKALRSEKLGRDADKVFAEAQALRQLDHPTILRVLDCGYVDASAKSRPFLVVDHFPGPTLEEHLQKHGPLPFDELLEVARQMADGLKAAHSKNILHRRVNPGSVMICKEGKAWRAKLIDFGLAPAPKSTGGAAKTLVAALDCAAPEQAGKGDAGEVGPTADVYGWARTCCYALFRTAQPLLSHWQSVPAPFAQLLERCLAYDQKKRPQGFAELIGPLDNLDILVAREKAETYSLAPKYKTRPGAPAPGEAVQQRQRAASARQYSWATSQVIYGLSAFALVLLIVAIVGGLVWRAKTRPATLMVDIDTPGAEIYLDGERYSFVAPDDREPFSIKVPRGTRQLKVIKPGFEPFLRDLTLKSGAEESVHVRLTPRQAAGALTGEPNKGKIGLANGAQRVPSPLDQLDPKTIPASDRNEKMTGLVAVLKGHVGPVWSLAFSADGKTLASAGEDKTVRLWELTGPSPRTLAVKNGHTSGVICVAFAPNRPMLASGSTDKTLRLWDLQEPAKDPVVLDGFTFVVARLAFAPDGRTLVTGSFDQGGTLTFWDMAQTPPRKKETVKGHEGLIVGLSYSPDGKTVASSGLGVRPTVLLWDLTDGSAKQRASLQHPPAWIYPVAFTPDNQTLATGSHDGKVRLWDLGNKEPTVRATLPWGNSKEGSMAYAPDGRTLVTGGGDGRVMLWNLSTLQKLQEWKLPGQATVVFAPDGRHLAAGCADGTIYILRLSPQESALPSALPSTIPRENSVETWTSLFNGKDLTGWQGHPGGARVPAETSWLVTDGMLVSKGLAGNLFTTRSDFSNFHLRMQVEISDPANHISFVYLRMPNQVNLASWANASNYEATMGRPLQSGQVRFSLLRKQGKVRVPVADTSVPARGWYTYEVIAIGNQITLKVDGQQIAQYVDPQPVSLSGRLGFNFIGNTVVRYRNIEIKELPPTGSTAAVLLRKFEGHNEDVLGLAFSPDGSRALSSHSDGQVVLWDAATGTIVKRMDGKHEGGAESVAFAPDATWAISGGRTPDQSVRIWDLANGKEKGVIRGFPGPVSRLIVFRDGTRALAGANLCLINLKTRTIDKTFETGIFDAIAIALSPNEKLALSGGSNNRISLWNVESGTKMTTFEPGHAGQIRGLAFSRDGKRAVTSSTDKTCRVWDVNTGKTLLVFAKHTTGVAEVAFLPDDRHVASIAWDNAVRIWDSQTGAEIYTIPLPAKGQTLAVAPDGRRILAGCTGLSEAGANVFNLSLWQLPALPPDPPSNTGNRTLP